MSASFLYTKENLMLSPTQFMYAWHENVVDLCHPSIHGRFAHEPIALKAGVSPAAIAAIKRQANPNDVAALDLTSGATSSTNNNSSTFSSNSAAAVAAGSGSSGGIDDSCSAPGDTSVRDANNNSICSSSSGSRAENGDVSLGFQVSLKTRNHCLLFS